MMNKNVTAFHFVRNDAVIENRHREHSVAISNNSK